MAEAAETTTTTMTTTTPDAAEPKAKQQYDAVNRLVAERGMTKLQAILALAEELGEKESAVSGNYYRWKRKLDGPTRTQAAPEDESSAPEPTTPPPPLPKPEPQPTTASPLADYLEETGKRLIAMAKNLRPVEVFLAENDDEDEEDKTQ